MLKKANAFTLIELSIVLVIIGLIVGGILVGQDLIRAAGVRATITQIEKYNSATNTFYGKYGYLPGDIPATPAAQFGFAARGPYPGQGDGNGLIQGNYNNSALGGVGHNQAAGETVMFWVDLSTANLIDGNFTTASSTAFPSGTLTATSVPSIGNYLPPAKLSGGNYFYAYNGGISSVDGRNYFGLSTITQMQGTFDPQSVPGLTVSQAYSIDKKIDDGLPQAGTVQTYYVSVGGMYWAAGGGNFGASAGGYTPTTAATPGSSTTCYDNGGVVGLQQYSIEISNGSNVNCALSFRFQ